MFAPTKIWRRWHRKINLNEKRYALVSSLAASAVPALVMARGHSIDKIPEVPLVVDNKVIDNLDKTAKAAALLKALNAYDDIEKSKDSRHIRAGKGKMRNRRYVQKRGPLLVYLQENTPMTKAFRNLPGLELCNVTRLNLLQLAPGGHLGRFVIWTRDAFERLDSLYGSFRKPSQEKIDYRLPRPIMTNPDLRRLLSSDEIQSIIRPKIPQGQRPAAKVKKNPLKNLQVRIKLNPYHAVVARASALKEQQVLQKRAQDEENRKKGIAPKVDPKVAAQLAAKKKKEKAKRKQYKKEGAKFRKILLS
jgi:large subunit ribosomal protein L4e